MIQFQTRLRRAPSRGGAFDLESCVEAEILKTVGQIAGIGGLALGVLLIVFRDIVRKKIFPTLPPAEAYRLLRLITVAVWSVAIVGIVAWVYVSHPSTSNVSADCGIVVGGNVSGSNLNNFANCEHSKAAKP
jgi:hypothetical protein